MEWTSLPGHADYDLSKYKQALKDHKKSGLKPDPKDTALFNSVHKASKWARHYSGKRHRAFKKGHTKQDSFALDQHRHDKVARMASRARARFQNKPNAIHLHTAMKHLENHHRRAGSGPSMWSHGRRGSSNG